MRISRLIQFGVAIALLGMFVVISARATDPPAPTIREAMGKGQAAFLAHAVKVELVAIRQFDSSARMTLHIDRCYYGFSCDRPELKMTYISHTPEEAAFGVTFTVGQEILFVLHTRPVAGKEYHFNSAFRGGIDFAFRGNVLPAYPGDEKAPGFESIYIHKAERISYDQLQELGEKRKGEFSTEYKRDSNTAKESHDVAKSFFKKPWETRLERLRQYSLEDQYRIFRRGNDHFEPPATELANPIAERGAAAIPFLLRQLEHDADDVGVRDILLILDKMTYFKSYDVAADTALMTTLTSRISAIKNKRLQETCLKMLQYTR